MCIGFEDDGVLVCVLVVFGFVEIFVKVCVMGVLLVVVVVGWIFYGCCVFRSGVGLDVVVGCCVCVVCCIWCSV